MVISLTMPMIVKKEYAEKTVEIRIPSLRNGLMKNKVVAAFYTVFSSPVK